MDLSRRKELEKLALERLNASADDPEQWFYAWGRGVCLSYCPWSWPEDHFGGFYIPAEPITPAKLGV
jgi:hypothetical protein